MDELTMFRGKLLFVCKFFGAHGTLGNVSSVNVATRGFGLQLKIKVAVL